ncbi:MAG: RloF protein [Desulfobacteraceae bacterium 4572_130]|nr:MAG: RloF protein [Desulfobacteraceae bacterium 4572_130]
MLMSPANQTFSELFSNSVKYVIPRFQRDYAWDQEHLEDLWADIKTLEQEGEHYMGYIVLQKKGEREFEVIDGQQRLVTFSFVVLAAMKKIQNFIDHGLEVDENKKRLSVFKERLIGSTNPVTLKVENKLSLNRNNHRYFREICSRMKVLNERRVSKTNSLLDKTFVFFVNRIKGKNGSEVAKFIENIISRMVFTKIVTHDNINAYKVFETLNARGVKLSTPDLLKNHIFSTISSNDDVSDETLDVLDEDWSTIVAQLGENDFIDFMRYHHNIQKQLITKKGLFKSVKQIAHTPELANQYLVSLKDYAPIYAALLNPNDEWWKSQGNDVSSIRHYLQGLQLFKIKQPFSVLMAALFDKFTDEEFVKALKYLYILSIRYNVICRFSPNDQEKAYNKIAMNVFNDTYIRASHIKNSKEFKKLYPDDREFKNAFEFYKMPSQQSSKKIRFLLTEIEKSFGRELNYLDTTLEHICPYNPTQTWYEDFGKEANEIVDRLGNMILLEKDELKRADFNTKKKIYLTSSFKLARKVGGYDIWDLANLNHYQQWLADQAIKTWKVD